MAQATAPILDSTKSCPERVMHVSFHERLVESAEDVLLGCTQCFLGSLPFMRRRLLRPRLSAISSNRATCQRTTCHRAPQECRAPPILLQWPAATHSALPVAPEW
jgi:hypothetical protein